MNHNFNQTTLDALNELRYQMLDEINFGVPYESVSISLGDGLISVMAHGVPMSQMPPESRMHEHDGVKWMTYLLKDTAVGLDAYLISAIMEG